MTTQINTLETSINTLFSILHEGGDLTLSVDETVDKYKEHIFATVEEPAESNVSSGDSKIEISGDIDRPMPVDMSEKKTLENMWKENLESKGVKLPKNGKLRIVLEYLHDNLGDGCNINRIKEHVLSKGETLTGTDPLQVRHLSTQSGWHIVKEGRDIFKLVSVTESHPGYITEKRASKLNKENWEKMKEEYGHACVNCASKDGEPLRWDLTKTTVLQQGHMDPRKDLTYDNCIPQCSFCNQAYKSNAIFNKRGFVVDFCKSGF